MSQLITKGIQKSFNERKVVNSVSFEVSSGKIIGLLGPNGAGKTTSFYMAVGLLFPDAGKVYLDDLDLTEYPIYQRARFGISYLPQESSIFKKLTVYENILVALEAINVTGERAKDRLNKTLEEFSISHLRDNYGYSLSGGERRRVEIARAIVSKPKFLLLDEPFAGIDPIAVNDIQKILKQLQAKDIGILITDHNVRETLGICDYAYILKEGSIEVEGTTEEIANSAKARKFYLGENFKL